MADSAPKLTRKQEVAILALLSEPTHSAAAAKARVGETTLYRWLADPDFQAAYRAVRRDATEQAVARLQRAAGEAVDTLRKNLTCGNPAAENTAAKAIIEQAIRGVELVDLAERVEALEAAANERGTG